MEPMTTDWLQDEIKDVLKRNMRFSELFPSRTLRVRRRGFSPNVKRGDIIQRNGKKWNVSRRSNWYLWLYEHLDMIGDTIRVKLPARFEKH